MDIHIITPLNFSRFLLNENVNKQATPASSLLAQNNKWKHQYHSHPKDLHFDLALDLIPPGFFKNITVDDLLFAIDKMIDILSHAKHW